MKYTNLVLSILLLIAVGYIYNRFQTVGYIYNRFQTGER